MRNTILLFGSIALTVLCWGMYGPTLLSGQLGMSTIGAKAIFRPFVCVGIAYFLIGVIVPALWLHLRGEKGDWTIKGVTWSLAGGALGAIGALAILLAFKFGGRPIYVMPLVFGGAPVINAFLTIFMAGRIKEIGPLFLAGLIIVLLGAMVVLLAAPHPASPAKAATPSTESQAASTASADTKTSSAAASAESVVWSLILRSLSIVLVIASWGAYGPVLHKGQSAMHHSRLRPLICVGISYLVIAVILPYFFLGEMGEESTYRTLGTLWSLLAGSFGAVGALGIIMAFNIGGRPVFVMPLVFGGAPVINTLVTIASTQLWDRVNPFFWAGLILVVAGSAMVLVLAPRGDGPAPELAQS